MLGFFSSAKAGEPTTSGTQMPPITNNPLTIIPTRMLPSLFAQDNEVDPERDNAVVSQPSP